LETLVTKSIVYLALLLLSHLFTSKSLAQENPIDAYNVDGVTVFADSRALDKLYGSTIRLDMGRMSIRELGGMRIGFGTVDNVLADKERPISVSLFVPADLPVDQQQQFKVAIEKQMTESYGAKNLSVTLVTIDVREAERAEALASAEIRLSSEHLPMTGKDDKAIAQELIRQNQNLVNTLREWSANFKTRMETILADYESRGMFVASMAGMASSAPPLYVWMTTTGFNVYGIAQAIIAIAYDQLNTTFAGKLVRFENEHQLPFNRPKSLVRFYNQSTLIKALTVNFAINAIAGSTFRMLSWLNAPERVAAPWSLEFLAELGGINAIGAMFTGGADAGMRQLRMKRRVSGFTELMVLSTFNFMNQLNNVMLGSGFTEYLPYGLAIEWTSKFSAFVLGKVLPTRNGEIGIFHPSLPAATVEQIKKQNDYTEAIRTTDLTTDRFRESFEKLEISASDVERSKLTLEKARAKLSQLREAANAAWKQSCGYIAAVYQQLTTKN
jgi:predicted DNA-binding protein (UPF0251 family)